MVYELQEIFRRYSRASYMADYNFFAEEIPLHIHISFRSCSVMLFRKLEEFCKKYQYRINSFYVNGRLNMQIVKNNNRRYVVMNRGFSAYNYLDDQSRIMLNFHTGSLNYKSMRTMLNMIHKKGMNSLEASTMNFEDAVLATKQIFKG